MKIIGLTGGIGSGKTTVANYFRELGVPVYIADDEAKKLMATSKQIKKELIELFGTMIYDEGTLNRAMVAKLVFKDKVLLEKLNAIIHPKVAADFGNWTRNQNATYCVKETAILFETGIHKNCDKTILVTAPVEIRIQRIMKRDGVNRQEILDRMKNQWSEERKAKLADFTVDNIDLQETKSQIDEIHRLLL